MWGKEFPQFVEDGANEGNNTNVYHIAEAATEESGYPFLDDVHPPSTFEVNRWPLFTHPETIFCTFRSGFLVR